MKNSSVAALKIGIPGRTHGMTDVIDIRTGLPITNRAEREAAQRIGVPVPVITASAARQSAATRLAVGCTVENGTLRIHRYSDHVVLWDLTNAGKRGRKVTKLSVSVDHALSAAHQNELMEKISVLLDNTASFGMAAAVLGELAAEYKSFHLTSLEERGVDIRPASFESINIRTEILNLTASYDTFHVECLRDTNNEPTAIPRSKGGKKSIPAFYKWVAANRERIQTMSFHQVCEAMREQGIQYHSYCAVD